ncbi:MAG: hypothetical protein SP1CHLAM54_00840 [Chlamydiia bacterium]|nr:hypothetical protein [Chlamydiia bacterium]MCH9615006.1 hypothetical protein [Chlamydiia bacterium]MCH9629944.1 hypothetical protein [Chlamydiia bacterium]
MLTATDHRSESQTFAGTPHPDPATAAPPPIPPAYTESRATPRSLRGRVGRVAPPLQLNTSNASAPSATRQATPAAPRSAAGEDGFATARAPSPGQRAGFEATGSFRAITEERERPLPARARDFYAELHAFTVKREEKLQELKALKALEDARASGTLSAPFTHRQFARLRRLEAEEEARERRTASAPLPSDSPLPSRNILELRETNSPGWWNRDGRSS